jgi:hypothetical protein
MDARIMITRDPTLRVPDGDWLESALVADAKDHAGGYVLDEGFTARVMSVLPPVDQAVPSWRKPAVIAMWVAAAAGACVALPGVAIDVGREAFSLLAAHPVSLPQIGAAVGIMALATWSAAAYALRHY